MARGVPLFGNLQICSRSIDGSPLALLGLVRFFEQSSHNLFLEQRAKSRSKCHELVGVEGSGSTTYTWTREMSALSNASVFISEIGGACTRLVSLECLISLETREAYVGNANLKHDWGRSRTLRFHVISLWFQSGSSLVVVLFHVFEGVTGLVIDSASEFYFLQK